MNECTISLHAIFVLHLLVFIAEIHGCQFKENRVPTFFKFLYKCIEIIKVLLQILTAPEAYFFCSF